MKELEILTYEHKGVKVRVKIDYKELEVSLIDNDNESKKWVFANRTTEYLNPWVEILEAMTIAVKESKKLLDAHIKSLDSKKPKSPKKTIN